MATYSVPLYRNVSGKRKFIGVVTADISLAWLQKIVAAIKIAETGYGFLISKRGAFVTHPKSAFIMNETIFSVAEARADQRIRELGRKMTQGQTGFIPWQSVITGKKCWMVYAPLAANGWSLGVLFPQNELMADIASLNFIVLILSFGGFLLILVVIVVITGSVTKPLRALSRAAAKIGTGDLAVELPTLKSRDEVGQLTESFRHMQSSLSKYIADLKETTAAKERIESELRIAHDIQMSILPKIFPPFPHRQDFDIYALIEPAKEVGGDFYDFFLLGDRHFCFVIGDVTGKGVPASLYMAVTKTLIKAVAEQGYPPGEILTRVNRELVSGNTSSMFVTVFLGILDTVTGRVLYANGGHNPPLVIRAQGAVDFLPLTGNALVGALEGLSYETAELVLAPGEALFLYTDGVTEASNREAELFSEDRLQESLQGLPTTSPHETIEAIKARIDAFAAGAPQADDIAMLMMRFQGRD